MSYGVGGSRRTTRQSVDQSDPGIQPAALHSPDLFTTILPIRDGLAVAIKK